MIEALKVAVILIFMLVLFYPLLHIRAKGKLHRMINVHARSYHYPNNKRNIFFVLFVLLEIAA